MNRFQAQAGQWLMTLMIAGVMGAGCTSSKPARAEVEKPDPNRVTIERVNYRGWPGAIVMSNGRVNAVVVPSVGRVMQFGFAGEERIFWENPELGGRGALNGDWAATEWVNLGGDKAWPSPEADWSKWTHRKGWRPPAAFDGLPCGATVEADGSVLLTSEVDPAYGIRVMRRVRLHPRNAVMTIQTVFEKIAGEPVKAGVWVITQLREPVGVYVPFPAASVFGAQGWMSLGKGTPPSLRVQQGLLSLTRDRSAPYKIGSDSGALLWIGQSASLLIDSSREEGSEYPDKGSSVEIYTSADPLAYIEMETLGPLATLKPGDRIERSNRYTLFPRSHPTADAEARAILEGK